MVNNFKIESPDQERLQRLFSELQYKDQRNIVISALRKATKPTVELAKSNIHHSVTGNLRKSIGLLTVRNEAAVIVGARKRKPFKGSHGHLVEEGTVDRWAKTWHGKPLLNKRFTGKMNASRPYAFWMKKAVNTTSEYAVNVMGAEWYNAIERFHVKYGLR
jgi:hypothetical protein